MENKKLQGILALTITTFICTLVLYLVMTFIGI